MVKMIDCASTITASAAASLKAAGVEAVGRYIGAASSWKTVKAAEYETIEKAGLKFVPIYETNPTYAGYFSYDRGVNDSQAAEKAARALGIPSGLPIFFTVDYDMTAVAFPKLREYLTAIKETLTSYKLGLYGSYSVIEFAESTGLVSHFFQTYAWSRGKVSSHAHLYQYKNGQSLAGITVDFDEIKKSIWPAAAKKEKDATVAAKKKAPNPYIVKSGDTLSEIGARYGIDWHDLKKWNRLDSDLIRPGQKLKTAATSKKKPAASSASVVPYPGHLIKRGATGKDVTRIQNAVGAKADGVFGPDTEKAVKGYQKRHGLSVDGIVGPKTWGVMF